MNVEEFREFCLLLPYTTEKMPFNESTLVFYVGGKMFALADIDTYEFINLKCEPDKALELRAEYEEVRPGYHMSKKHWNSVYLDGSITNSQLKEWIKDSYDLVYQSLTKKLRNELEANGK